MAPIIQPFYHVGQGELYVAELLNGVAQAYQWIGNCPKFMIDISSDSVEHRESYTGNLSIDREIKIKPEVKLSFEVDSINQAGLKALFKSRLDTTTSVSVTNENAIIDPATKVIIARGSNISAVVVRQTTGATVVAGTNYDVLPGGLIQFKSSYTPPVDGLMNIDYTSGIYNANSFFVDSINKEYTLRLIGKNMAEGDKPFRAEVYRTKLLADGGIPMIGEEFQSFSSSSRVLLDSNRLPTAVGGQYYSLNSW